MGLMEYYERLFPDDRLSVSIDLCEWSERHIQRGWQRPGHAYRAGLRQLRLPVTIGDKADHSENDPRANDYVLSAELVRQHAWRCLGCSAGRGYVAVCRLEHYERLFPDERLSLSNEFRDRYQRHLQS